jgi:hypothetical protein
MYWFMQFSVAGLLQFAGLSLAWAAGGWLLAVHVFRLRPGERLVAGLASGLLLFLTISNLLANLIQLTPSLWLAGLLILALGLAAAFRSGSQVRFPWRDVKHWQPLAALGLLVVLFTLIQRGLALFDEFQHMPMVSIMAAGDIPPHFYLDPAVKFTYHYGLQIFAAALIRLAGFTPWAALDLSKAITISFTTVLGYLWIMRKTNQQFPALAGAFALVFASGTRWLLLFLPPQVINRVGEAVIPINTGAYSGTSLLDVLTSSWNIEGGGPVPFPFAFHSGSFLPVIFNLGATGAAWFMIVITLLLLSSSRKTGVLPGSVYVLLLAGLALNAEHLFALLWAGFALILLLAWIRGRRVHQIKPQDLGFWVLILGASALVSALQGGFVTEFLRSQVAALTGTTAAQTNYHGFALRWPPAIPTAHFSDLGLFNPAQLLVMLLEFGPVFLLVPPATWYAWRRWQRGDWMAAALGAAAWLNLLFVLFIRYGLDRSITRMPATALWLWLLLGIPPLWFYYQKSRRGVRAVIQAGYLVTVFAGLVIFSIQLIAIPRPQLTYFINGLDARIASQFWNRLPEGAQVLDGDPSRAVTLFGRSVRASSDVYDPYPEWEALIAYPDPEQVIGQGYDFVYMDEIWWKRLPPELQAAYQQHPTVVLGEASAGQEFRRLYDLRSLKPAPTSAP